jgi:hypothetical protein
MPKYFKIIVKLYFRPSKYHYDDNDLDIDIVNDIDNHIDNITSIREIVNNLNITPNEYMEGIGSYWGFLHSAKWLSDSDMECIIKLDEYFSNDMYNKNTLTNYLIDNSLEDGEYESSESNGWTLKTSKGYEYGLIDFRNKKSIIVEDYEMD